MPRYEMARIAVAIWIGAGTAWSLPASAQNVPLFGVVIPCCTCTDGSVLTVDISTGATPWRVVAPNGTAAWATSFAAGQSLGWTPGSPARWIRHPSFQGVGYYDYEFHISMRKCVIPARITIGGQFAADNGGSLQLDQNPRIATHPVMGFRDPVTVPFTSLKQGGHVIRVRVHNQNGRTGFVLRGAITVRCPQYSHVIEAYAVPADR